MNSETPTIVICACCYYQFDPTVEKVGQDLDIGYVCADCYTQLKWAGAYLKMMGMPKCSKIFNTRGNEEITN